MRQYERYLFLHLLWPTVLITGSLTAIVWLTQILRFLDFMLSRGLSLVDFLYLTGLMLPSLLLMLIPISLAIAVIYTYNKLTVESELIVLNAVGVSKWEIARPALMLGTLCMIFCYALSLYVMPRANQHFQDIRTFFRDKYASVLLEEQVFSNPVDGLTLFIRERDSNNNLYGILLQDNREPKQVTTMLADEGALEQTPNGPRFHLKRGLRQLYSEGRVSWLKFDDYTIDIAFYGQDVQRKVSANERTIGELFQREGLTEKQARAYRAEAHQRLSWPALALALPLFVMATLFSSEFNRRGQGKRIISAAVGLVGLVLVYFTVRNLTVNHGGLAVLLYAMVLVPGGVGAYLLITGRVLRFSRPVLLPQEPERGTV